MFEEIISNFGKMKNRYRDKKKITYNPAPSGAVTIYNYKEPLQKFKDGHGFIGALLFDEATDKVQCHICGGWFVSLSHHIWHTHGMKAYEYKDKVGLLRSSALIGEKMRAKLIANGLDKRLQNLRRGHKKTQAEKEKIRATLKANYAKAENKNLRGTCHLQLAKRLQELKERLKRVPTTREIPFYESMIRAFGTTKKAFEYAGLKYIGTQGQTGYHSKDLKPILLKFKIDYGRKASYSDCRRGLIPSVGIFSMCFGSFKKALKECYK